MSIFKSLNAWLSRHIGWLFLGGLVSVALFNWRLWQRDKVRLGEMKEPEPLSPLEEWSEQPLVSVLVAAWNEAELIERHIKSFLALRYPNRELILCAGGDDSTYELAGGLAGENAGRHVLVLKQHSGEGKQRSLRRCLRHAKGDVIFLTDADCMLSDDAFERTLAPLLIGESVATGSNRPLADQIFEPFVSYQWHYHTYGAAQHGPYVAGLEGRNTAIQMRALETIGGFDADVPIGTDYFLSRQLNRHGYDIRYVYHSEVSTKYPLSYAEYCRQRSRWQRNIVVHSLKAGNLAPIFFQVVRGLIGSFMLFIPLLLQFWSPVILYIWSLMLVQGTLSRFRYTKWALQYRNTGTTSLQPPHLLTYMFVDFVSWVYGWIEIANPTQRWNW